jgi:hypothetical protein
MASFVSTDGLLKVLDAVRRDFPEEGPKIIDGILQLVRACGPVVALRYYEVPGVDANSIVDEFIGILNMQSVDGTRNLNEHMLTVCADVEGLLFTQCATRWASVLLAANGEGMVLCGGDGAGRCAEKFYEESRQAYRLTKPVRVFRASPPYGAISQIGTQGHWERRHGIYNAAVARRCARFVDECKRPTDLLTLPGVTADDRELQQAVTDYFRERLCLAVFPGTQNAYCQPMGDVLRLAYSTPKRIRSWDEDFVVRLCRVVYHDDDPFHRFWCWTVEVLNAKSRESLTPLLAEAAAHRMLFDQIAFDQCAYGDYRLVYTWLVMREYAYRYGDNRAQVPPCWLDSPPDASAFSSLAGLSRLPVRHVSKLFSICGMLGGEPWRALLADKYVYGRWLRMDKDLALSWIWSSSETDEDVV